MNIEVQCCGILLMLAILHFYTKQKKLRLNTGAAFFRLFLFTLLGLFLDVISLIALNFQEDLKLSLADIVPSSVPEVIVNIICKSYLSSLILTALSAVLYICRDIYVQQAKYKKISRIYSIIAIIGIGIVFFLPIQKNFEDPDHFFTYGPSVMATYGFCICFLAVAIIYLSIRKKNMNILRWEAMRIWLLLWIGAAFIQFIYNELLLVGFSGAFGIMILYLKLENLENNLDQKSGLFNKTSFIAYVRQIYGEEKNFSVLVMSLPHNTVNLILSEKGKEIFEELVKYLQDIHEAIAFRSEEDEILLLFNSQENADKSLSILKNRFEFGWGSKGDVFIRPQWFMIPDAKIVDKAEDLLYLIQHVRQSFALQQDVIMIDKKILDNIYEEKKVEQLIDSALKNDRVAVYYQPIYSLEEERFVSAEALIRIYDEQGNIIPPAQFIEIAEKNGMIMKLGEVVFEKVCRFLRDDKPEQYGLRYIEVNLSVVQCAYEHLADNFIRIMHAFQIDPKMINLEITESSSIGGGKQTLLQNMNRLIDYGVEFSLDDFGTGHSNLNYIVEMPVEIVKFDRSMILSYFENGKAKYVMDAAMHMIQGMKLPIVSEGIETKEQLNTMKELGINYIQGFYFSKPLQEKEFLRFLTKNNK